MAGAGSYNNHNVMISYNSGSKETVFKIRDYLKQNGVTFWIDVEHMSGSTLDAMSEAVENCTVFLMCYSAKYSQSENCKSEAEYARKRKKIIIPCKMEKGFDPSGWLGILIGSKIFYDFSGKYPFEKKMQELLRVVNSHLKTVTDVSLPRKGETSRRMVDDPIKNNKGAEVDYTVVMEQFLQRPASLSFQPNLLRRGEKYLKALGISDDQPLVNPYGLMGIESLPGVMEFQKKFT